MTDLKLISSSALRYITVIPAMVMFLSGLSGNCYADSDKQPFQAPAAALDRWNNSPTSYEYKKGNVKLDDQSRAAKDATARALSINAPLLKAPYTLIFSAEIKKPIQLWLTHIGSENLQQAGKITISSNSENIVYIAVFGKWKSVAIYDTLNNIAYTYDSVSSDPGEYDGAENALSNMWLLPLPGVGYDFYPMFQSFQYSGKGVPHGTMAVVGDSKAIQYQDTNIVQDHRVGFTVLANCEITVPGQASEIQENWVFSEYKRFDSIHVASFIDRTINIAIDKTQPPSNNVKPDGQILYTLLNASQQALPDRDYIFKNYLPVNCSVTDYRKSH